MRYIEPVATPRNARAVYAQTKPSELSSGSESVVKVRKTHGTAWHEAKRTQSGTYIDEDFGEAAREQRVPQVGALHATGGLRVALVERVLESALRHVVLRRWRLLHVDLDGAAARER